MDIRARLQHLVPTAAAAAVAAVALVAAFAGRAEAAAVNVTAGGPLRPGVYGRIELGRGAPPPPLIHPQPVVVKEPLAAATQPPVLLYVPPGQVRRWERHCHKWDACSRPVLFVRMDDSLSRLGKWKQSARPAPAPGLPGMLHAFAPRDD